MILDKSSRASWCAGTRHATTLLALIFPLASVAADIPWRGGNLHYVAEGRPLSRVLKDILDTQGFPVTIQSDLRSPVNGEFNGDARSIMKKLEAAYNFVPYFDGYSMEVVGASDLKTAVLPVAPLSVDKALLALKKLDLIEVRFPIRSSQGTLRVSGPSRYIDMLTLALDNERQQAMELSLRQTSQGMTMRMFPLKYAMAQDTTYTINRTQYEVPGAARLLSNLISGSQVIPATSSSEIEGSAVGEKFGMRRNFESAAPAVSRQAAAPTSLKTLSVGGRIQPDARTNSIIIYDVPEMMDVYQSLIKDLDQPQELVQIDVAVIDINAEVANSLGINWGFGNGKISLSLGELGLSALRGAGGSSSLTARINLLEGEGKATVLARPKVLTLNNSEAVLGSQSSLYVKVAGERNVELFPIDAGLLMRVTPLIIREGDAVNVRMSVSVEDGGFQQGADADEVPQVNRNFITTQAVVGNGESLLIGGYQFDKVNSGVSGVPFLKSIPIIGGLFRSKRNGRQQTERLFLITPRLVAPLTRQAAPGELPRGSSGLSPRAKDSVDQAVRELAPAVVE